MGPNKREQKSTKSAASSTNSLPFANITASSASGNNAQMAESKGKKKARNKDKVDSISVKCGVGRDADELQCTSKPVKTHNCTLPDDIVSGLKKCAISQQSKPKKTQKEDEDDELQSLVDFINGKDASKENSAPGSKKKPKKKKKQPPKPDVKECPASQTNGTAEPAATLQRKETDSKRKQEKSKDTQNGSASKQGKGVKNGIAKGACGSSDTSSNCSSDSVVKPKKPKKAAVVKPPSQEELEVMKLLQYIEGPSEKPAAAANSASDQNNNSDKKKKKKAPKSPKEFDFDALRENTHLEQKMIDEILKNPTCVNEHRLFNPKQVAMMFSTGHNEHWEKFPECDGRLKPLERSREGLTLCDPGSKQLQLVFAELHRQKGKNITKLDFINALKCNAYLHCAKCGYQSDIVSLH